MSRMMKACLLTTKKPKSHVVFGAPYTHFRLFIVQCITKKGESMLPLINVTKYTDILRINTSICEKLHLERVALRCHACITVLTHKIFNDPACFAIYNSCCNLLGHKPCISDESWSNTDSKNIYFDRSSAFRFLATVQ